MPGDRDAPTTFEPGRRDRVLSTVAVLLALYAVLDFTMPIQQVLNPHMGGAMVFGVCFHGVPSNAVVGPLLGSLGATYAYGMWKRKPWLLRIAIGYALYMPVNFLMFWFLHPELAKDRVFPWVAYHAVLMMGYVGSGIYVTYHRERFQ